ncbi:hypothetical protein H9P43_009498 [Blastocladiella emersonii ATCC 22665]|nr:hypothetical protein H9P43_009498 [Blastocladiella emersonii ATCC 22665]
MKPLPAAGPRIPLLALLALLLATAAVHAGAGADPRERILTTARQAFDLNSSVAILPDGARQQQEPTADSRFVRGPRRLLVSPTGEATELATASPDPSAASSTGLLYQVACDRAVPASLCNRATLAVDGAARRLLAAFTFPRPVYLAATFFRPCGAETAAELDQCDEKNTLGAAAPAAQWPVRFPGLATALPSSAWVPGYPGVVAVPQALARQLNVTVRGRPVAAVNAGVDIIAGFNALADWWVAGDPAEIRAGQEDLEYAVLHEAMHGLGFGIDSWTYDADKFPNALLPNVASASPTAGSALVQFPALWDAFVVAAQSNGSWTPWLAGYADWTSAAAAAAAAGLAAPKSAATLLAASLADQRVASQAAWRLAAATTDGAVAVAVPADVPLNASLVTLRNTRHYLLPVESAATPFAPGSSLSHWSWAVAYTAPPSKWRELAATGGTANTISSPDVLMAATTLPVSLRGEAGQRAIATDAGWIGPATRAVMRNLGFAVRGMPPADAVGAGGVLSTGEVLVDAADRTLAPGPGATGGGD